MGAVVVSTSEGLRKRLPKRADFETAIAWAASGRQVLHGECWASLLGEEATLAKSEVAMLQKAAETLERYDSTAELRSKAACAASLLLSSRPSPSLVAFTGAGISEGAGIPTYRGTAGIDTKAALGHEEEAEGEGTDFTALEPTAAHRVLVDLEKRQLLTYTITQNCDNLHAKAGTSRARLSELHGNIFAEYCEECAHEVVRAYEVIVDSTEAAHAPWYVECPDCHWGHYTGRRCACAGCGGKLRDTIINFGDALRADVLRPAVAACASADMCLALGSSLSVSPANELPLLPTHLVIANPQATHLDEHADVRAYGTADAFTALLAEALRAGRPTEAACASDTAGTVAAGVTLVSGAKKARARAAAVAELGESVQYAEEQDAARHAAARERRQRELAVGSAVGKKGKKRKR